MPYLEVNGTTLYYEDAGTGLPLLFLHGWAASSQVWNAQLADLVPDHRVVTVDQRGCGRSERPLDGNNLTSAIADLAEIIRALELHRPVVIGSSMGATFATELGLRHPDLVGGVVPVDGPAYWPSSGMDVEPVLRGLHENRAETVAAWVPGWYTSTAPEALVDWTIRHILNAGVHIDEFLAWIVTYDPRPSLPELQVPIHYLHGELDTQIPIAVAEACAALSPGATLTAVRGAGHMPHLERAAEFNAALRTVLDRIPTPSTILTGGR